MSVKLAASCQLPFTHSIGNWQMAANFTLSMPIRHFNELAANCQLPFAYSIGNWQMAVNFTFWMPIRQFQRTGNRQLASRCQFDLRELKTIEVE